jgi:hypothetical protein
MASGAVCRKRVVGTAGSRVLAMARSLWVAQLIVSDRTAEKLSSRHGLDVGDVRQAVVGIRGLQYVWDEDKERGRRALVEADVAGRVCIIVLYPVEHPLGDVYALGSAYPR